MLFLLYLNHTIRVWETSSSPSLWRQWLWLLEGFCSRPPLAAASHPDLARARLKHLLSQGQRGPALRIKGLFAIENWQESGGLINSGRCVRFFQINLKPPRVVLCLCASSKSVIAADNHREFAALYIHRCLWPFMGDVCQLRSQWLRPGVLVSLRTILLE